MLKLQYFVQLMRRDPDAEKDCSQKDKGVAGNEMVRWHHQLNGHEFERTLNSRTEEPGVLQCTGSQRFRHKLVTEQQWATQQLTSVQTFKLLITCIYTILSGILTLFQYQIK